MTPSLHSGFPQSAPAIRHDTRSAPHDMDLHLLLAAAVASRRSSGELYRQTPEGKTPFETWLCPSRKDRAVSVRLCLATSGPGWGPRANVQSVGSWQNGSRPRGRQQNNRSNPPGGLAGIWKGRR